VSENHTDPAGATPAPLDDAAIERLLGEAGKRSPIPRDTLDAIAGSARAAWQARERQRSPEPAGAAPTRTPTPRRRRSRAIGVLALAAALTALLFGARMWWRARDADPLTVAATAPVRVARVEVASPSLRVEEDGVERTVAAGAAINAGAIVRHSPADAGTGGMQPAGAALRLESGAVIRFDAGAAARLASSARIDLLAGAIYADTDPDATGAAATRHPRSARLEVHTPVAVARDIGTRFMARLVAGHPETVQVLVRDGEVEVEHEGESRIARSGERIIARAGGALELGPALTWGPEWAWVLDATPPFEIAGRSVAEILEWVARETGWTVRYEDAAVAADARETIQQASRELGALRPDQAPFGVLPTANLEGEFEAGVLTVRRQRGR
jgi:hypothetical protein